MGDFAMLQQLVNLVGPPGAEGAVADFLVDHLNERKISTQRDAKGNIIVQFGEAPPRVAVVAHMDEIAMIIRGIRADGQLEVGPLGGLKPWKLGEGPVQVRGLQGVVDGVLSFGGIHSNDARSVVRQADSSAISWEQATILTGLSHEESWEQGIRVGCRAVVHPSRRALFEFNGLLAGYFMDDRALLVPWLAALSALQNSGNSVAFIATVSEETGGEGAAYALRALSPETVIALELGPHVVDAPVVLSETPTAWVTDSYATLAEADLQVLASLLPEIQFQSLSRGGSDASIAASLGLCARHFTLGIPMANSHGYEVIHPGSLAAIQELLVRLIEAVS